MKVILVTLTIEIFSTCSVIHNGVIQIPRMCDDESVNFLKPAGSSASRFPREAPTFSQSLKKAKMELCQSNIHFRDFGFKYDISFFLANSVGNQKLMCRIADKSSVKEWNDVFENYCKEIIDNFTLDSAATIAKSQVLILLAWVFIACM